MWTAWCTCSNRTPDPLFTSDSASLDLLMMPDHVTDVLSLQLVNRQLFTTSSLFCWNFCQSVAASKWRLNFETRGNFSAADFDISTSTVFITSCLWLHFTQTRYFAHIRRLQNWSIITNEKLTKPPSVNHTQRGAPGQSGISHCHLVFCTGNGAVFALDGKEFPIRGVAPCWPAHVWPHFSRLFASSCFHAHFGSVHKIREWRQ